MDVQAIKQQLDNFFSTLAESFPGYEQRDEQVQMINLILNGLYTKKHVLVEAGTGTGKSLAYLLAILALLATDERKKVVISTHTINLQEQLVSKDIPALQEILTPLVSFQTALAKGRNNYVCKRRLLELMAADKSHSFATLEQAKQFYEIRPLLYADDEFLIGERNALPVRVHSEIWDLFNSSHDTCLEHRCPLARQCFFRAAREELKEADIIISNHALFFADLALRGSAANEEGILPAYDLVIFDEAHHVEDVASTALSIRIDGYYLKNLGGSFRSLLSRSTIQEYLTNDAPMKQYLETLLRSYFSNINLFLRELQLRSKGNNTMRFRSAAELGLENPFQEDIAAILRICDHLVSLSLSDEEEALLQKQVHCWTKLNQDLDFVLDITDDAFVYWIENISEQRPDSSAIIAAPIAIAPTLREALFDHDVVTVLTSATLATPNLTFTSQRLGIDNYLGRVLASPFDHQNHAAIYVPPNAPEPDYRNNQAYESYLCKLISYIVPLVNGGCFILFTSYQTLNNVYDGVIEQLSHAQLQLFKQGELPRHLLLAQYKQASNAVLFGTSSFWEGVDVVGNALRCVIITKLPFAVPDHPITQARIEALRQQGHNPFMEYQLPQAVVKLKQGYGRLIRSQTDHGLVVIADPRVHTKRYGRLFLESLPCKHIITNSEQLQQFVQLSETQWYQEAPPKIANKGNAG